MAALHLFPRGASSLDEASLQAPPPPSKISFSSIETE